ncbi:AIPR family protein [Homoserinibacter sp. GY 40078]|uniref:AIPR family protein n=1 Tax=Homoserinibacter sp. GY 40078 TaxID=2603275 RepID=UPI0011C70BFC|nr:AIPR family protein [Homoserinibacter sp. GY 40078]TXK18650.1 AIPR family protein [Homoserinibacter sp. GY 40078]
MEASDLEYAALKVLLKPIEERTGLGESAAFLNWFLRNVYRLEDTEARDAICDHGNDKGIDGIFIDHNNEEIHFFQSKIKQAPNGKVGDVGPKNFIASVQQFDQVDKVASLLAGNADVDLKRLVVRTGVAEMVSNGYALVGIYVTNESNNADSIEYANITPALRIFDRAEIASKVIDIDATEGQKQSFTFDTSYVAPMAMQSGAGKSATSMYVFPARALQLVHMDGISDGTLFRANVRYTLGNTAVNKSIRQSIAEKSSHGDFVLFHNGIIILCAEVDDSVVGELTIKNYSVVNGAQSLTSFYATKAKLTDDLRVIVRVIMVQDEELAKTITHNSNNQNAIRPRDLRSNHAIMLRLQKEMDSAPGSHFFEIKRGEVAPPGTTVITNDEVGRALLAFDLKEPWLAHQVYKVFDEKYADIFGRPEVTASRVVFVHRLVQTVDAALPGLKNKPMGSYTLTRYFVLYVLARILRANEATKQYVAAPSLLTEAQMADFLTKCGEILKTVVVDLSYEASEGEFDYKSILKSPNQSTDLAGRVLASYEKDVARGKAESFNGWDPS